VVESASDVCDRYAWATPDARALKILNHFDPIIEVGAGAGPPCITDMLANTPVCLLCLVCDPFQVNPSGYQNHGCTYDSPQCMHTCGKPPANALKPSRVPKNVGSHGFCHSITAVTLMLLVVHVDLLTMPGICRVLGLLHATERDLMRRI
jgi:hypothetical protein